VSDATPAIALKRRAKLVRDIATSFCELVEPPGPRWFPVHEAQSRRDALVAEGSKPIPPYRVRKITAPPTLAVVIFAVVIFRAKLHQFFNDMLHL
jgi:hypothetical protein